jgi:hypothetical protein
MIVKAGEISTIRKLFASSLVLTNPLVRSHYREELKPLLRNIAPIIDMKLHIATFSNVGISIETVLIIIANTIASTSNTKLSLLFINS